MFEEVVESFEVEFELRIQLSERGLVFFSLVVEVLGSGLEKVLEVLVEEELEVELERVLELLCPYQLLTLGNQVHSEIRPLKDKGSM